MLGGMRGARTRHRPRVFGGVTGLLRRARSGRRGSPFRAEGTPIGSRRLTDVSEVQVLRNPVMIAAFEGWNDAGDAATAAVEQLGLTWDATPLTELDPEGFYDFQVTRPTVKLIDGVTRTIEWPTTRLSACRLPDSPNDVILVHGIEPNFRWRAFCDELLKIAVDQQVSTVIGLGALLADVPHTRPIQVTGSAHDADTAAPAGPVPLPVRGTDRHLRRVPGRLRAGRHPVLVVLGVGSALRLAGAVPEGHAGPAAPGRGDPGHRGAARRAARRRPTNGRPRSRRSRPRTTRSPSTSGRSRSARRPTSRCSPASGESIAAEFERYLRRRGPKPDGRR